MFKFLKRKHQLPARSEGFPPLHFRDGSGALEYACKYLECSLHEGALLPALVLDARELFGASSAVQKQHDGNQAAMLRVASQDGGFVVLATTAAASGPSLQPGDFVAWQAGKHSPDVAVAMSATDSRSGWIGLIVGTLKPEHSEGRWVGGARYTP